MSDTKARRVIDNLTGGRNGFDPPWAIRDTECVDAVNVDWYRSRFAHKRGGMASVSTTFSAGGPFTGIISSLFRHVPGTDQTAAELWAIDNAATNVVGRMAAAATFTAPSLKDAPTGNGFDWTAASINAKLSLAYKSGQARHHVWDGSTVRRAGLIASGAPTAANTGSGGSIAFSAAATLVYGGTLTFTHTCGGSDTLLVVGVRSTSVTTAVTYNSVAMTQIGTTVSTDNYYLFYLVNPTSGAHTVAITTAGNAGAASASYTGSSGGLANAQLQSSAGTTIVTSLTTTTDNNWTVYFVADRSGNDPTAGTNSTARATPGTSSSIALFDSGAAITPPAAFSMTANITAASAGVAIMASFVPASGSVSAVARYYRERSTTQVASVTTRRSEPSASVAFTPSGSGTAARVTQATVINEGETHWEVEASTDNVTFYRIATVVIGTTTYDDSAATTSYASNPLSALTGVYTLPKPYKFVAADQNRHLGLSSWTSTDKQARLEISAVIGSLDISDDERIDTSAINSYIDFDENDSGVPTGLAGPVLGAFFVFKDRRTWQLTPTGLTAQPYQQEVISKDIGALNQQAVARGEDASGSPALYWMSHRGPYQWTTKGLAYIGRNVEDFVLTGTTINLAATSAVARTVYYADKRQVWFWWATGSANDPTALFIYDVTTGGWSRAATGDLLANVRCAVMFSNTLGATMSLDLKPYVGQTGASNTLMKCDSSTSDNGTLIKAYVITKAYEGTPGFFSSLGDPILMAQAASGVTITDTITADFGVTGGSGTGTAVLTAAGSETRVSVPMSGASLGGPFQFYQHQVGDAVASTSAWTLDRLIVPSERREAVTR